MSLLTAHDPRPLAGNYPAGLKPLALYLGPGGRAPEIAVFESAAVCGVDEADSFVDADLDRSHVERLEG